MPSMSVVGGQLSEQLFAGLQDKPIGNCGVIVPMPSKIAPVDAGEPQPEEVVQTMAPPVTAEQFETPAEATEPAAGAAQ